MASDQDREYPVPVRKRRNSMEKPMNFSPQLTPDAMNEYMTLSGTPQHCESTNTRATEERDFSRYILENVKLDDGPPARYQLRAERVNLDRLLDEDSKLRRFSVGNKDPRHQNKTVLLVGATGSGKSTLINALVNFVMGVKFEDKVWFEIVPEEKNRPQSESQTTAVSVYEVFGFEGETVPYSLTIIDTPGYGDTRGTQFDDIVTKQLQDLFCIPEGVKAIDAVGLVLKATENRLDERMSYIFNSVTSLFGRDMEQNIVALMTYSDWRKPKLALQALEEAKVKCARKENNEPVYFRFNNCQKEKIEDEEEAERAQMDFKKSNNGMKDLTEFLGQCLPLPLKTTVEALRERNRLTACIQNLKERIETVEIQQEAIEENQDLLNNKEETSVKETHKQKEVIESECDTKALTCKTCEENCHYPGCTGAWGPRQCEVMKDGRCTSCSGKCPVEEHVKENWRYVTKIRSVTKKEMKSSEQMEKETSDLEQTKQQCLVEAFQLIEKLQQSPLPVDSLSTYEHLEFLKENMEKRGDTEKVQTLIKYQKTPGFQLKLNVLSRTNKKRNIEKKFKKISTKINDGPPARYQLKVKTLNLDRLSDKESKLRKFTVGKRDHKYPNKTVLLVGATGSGKSTLINALVNFVMGVKFEDKVWFEIVEEEKNKSQTETQTTAVSVYEVFGFEGKTVPYSLTIIDTPGYGDTRGIEFDDVVTKQLQDLFCIPEGVKTIDAVGLVLKATENRLDERMSYIFNSVTSLFGRDMEQNIVALMTYSHGRKPTDALQALDEAKVTCARNESELVHFCFNNCQKRKIEDKEEAERAQSDFEMSNNGMKNLTDFMEHCRPQSLKTTVEVMKERIRLTACIQNLKDRVETIIMKQKAIKWNKEQVLTYEEEMKKNQNFIIKAKQTYKGKEVINGWWDNKAVTCNNCKENCHYPGCTWAWGPSWCEVMKNGNCISCTGKCPVKDHVKENKKYVTKTKTETTTNKEMKDKYDENKAQSEVKTTLVEDMEKEMATLQQQKNQCLNEAFQIIVKLEQIALKADSVFTYVHMEFLMENMKESGDTEKVQTLETMIERMDEKNKAAVNYFRKSVKLVKNKLNIFY